MGCSGFIILVFFSLRCVCVWFANIRCIQRYIPADIHEVCTFPSMKMVEHFNHRSAMWPWEPTQYLGCVLKRHELIDFQISLASIQIKSEFFAWNVSILARTNLRSNSPHSHWLFCWPKTPFGDPFFSVFFLQEKAVYRIETCRLKCQVAIAAETPLDIYQYLTVFSISSLEVGDCRQSWLRNIYI